MHTEPADLLYGVPSIAGHLGIRLQQAHHQIRKGALPTFRVGGVICARKSTIAAWIAKQESEALAPKPPEFTPPGDLPPLHTRSAGPELITRKAGLSIGSYDPATRTFTAVAATSTPVPRFSWRDDATVHEVLVIDATSVDLAQFASGRAPILDTHQKYATGDVIGAIRSARIEGGELIVVGEISDREDLAGLRNDLAAGIIRNVSVGYEITAREVIEATAGKPATVRVTGWRPRELSLVPLGADPNSYIRSAGDPPMSTTNNTTREDDALSTPAVRRPVDTQTRAERTRVSDLSSLAERAGMPAADLRAAIEDGTSVAEFRTRAFDFMAAQDAQVRTGPIRHGGEDGEARSRAISDALYARMTGKAPEGQAREYASRSIVEIGREMLIEAGVREARSMGRERVAEAMMSRSLGGLHGTSDFPTLLSSAGNRVLADAYRLQESPLKKIARKRTRVDYRPVTAIAVSEMPRLEKVGQSGEIKRTTIDEQPRPLYTMYPFARIIGFSRQALINDDLGAFADGLSLIGKGAAQTEREELTALLVANTGNGVNTYDGKTLFHADHKNIVGAGAALSIQSLSAVRTLMRLQKGIDGKTFLNIEPKHLLVPPELETVAEQILSQLVHATQTSNVNVFTGKFDINVEPALSAVSATAFSLFADPGVVPVIEIAYLEGNETPELRIQEGFDKLGTEFRAVLDFGCGLHDWRGAAKNPGS